MTNTTRCVTVSLPLCTLHKNYNHEVPSHRFESVHDGHHDVASVVPLEIEEIDGAHNPKVDARQP